MHFTPVHCSWMNQVEQWFSILQRKRLTAPNFADLAALEERILAFIAEWNESAHPFAWTAKSFDKVLAKIDGALPEAARNRRRRPRCDLTHSDAEGRCGTPAIRPVTATAPARARDSTFQAGCLPARGACRSMPRRRPLAATSGVRFRFAPKGAFLVPYILPPPRAA